MQAPFLLTQSRTLHNDSMCKKKRELKVIPFYKIEVVRTYILNILTHWPPCGITTGWIKDTYDIISKLG